MENQDQKKNKYVVVLTDSQIFYLQKICEEIMRTPGVKFSKKPERRLLFDEVSDILVSFSTSLELGPIPE